MLGSLSTPSCWLPSSVLFRAWSFMPCFDASISTKKSVDSGVLSEFLSGFKSSRPPTLRLLTAQTTVPTLSGRWRLYGRSSAARLASWPQKQKSHSGWYSLVPPVLPSVSSHGAGVSWRPLERRSPTSLRRVGSPLNLAPQPPSSSSRCPSSLCRFQPRTPWLVRWWVLVLQAVRRPLTSVCSGRLPHLGWRASRRPPLEPLFYSSHRVAMHST